MSNKLPHLFVLLLLLLFHLVCNKEPKLPHTHSLRSGLAVTIYAQDLLLTIVTIYVQYLLLTIYAHDRNSQSTLRFSRHDLCSRFTTHDRNSQSTLRFSSHNLCARFNICAHDLELTIYYHGLRSRSTLTVCDHDLAPQIIEREEGLETL